MFRKPKLAELWLKNLGRLYEDWLSRPKGLGATSGRQVQLDEIFARKALAALEIVANRFKKYWKFLRFLKGCRCEEKGNV